MRGALRMSHLDRCHARAAREEGKVVAVALVFQVEPGCRFQQAGGELQPRAAALGADNEIDGAEVAEQLQHHVRRKGEHSGVADTGKRAPYSVPAEGGPALGCFASGDCSFSVAILLTR